MTDTLFFSWQSDTPPIVGRNFIERALERAIGQLNADLDVEEPQRDAGALLELDRDTKGVSGQPKIVDTIFEKIDSAALVLADVTLSGKRLGGEPAPNPNVLIEYGWALKSLTERRVITIMNTAYGRPEGEALPFDMRHMRFPIQYHLEADADEATRRSAREDLVKTLVVAIKEGLATARPAAEPARFPRRGAGASPGRYRAEGVPLGYADGGLAPAEPVHAPPGPAAWMRLMPVLDPGRTWTITQLKAVAHGGDLFAPYGIGQGHTNLGWLRDQDGVGTRIMAPDEQFSGAWTSFLFTTGEIWGLDTWVVGASPRSPVNEGVMTHGLANYVRTLQRLGIPGPYRWIIGFEGLKGRSIADQGLNLLNGVVLTDPFIVEGEISDEDEAGAAILTVVNALRDAAGLPHRPRPRT